MPKPLTVWHNKLWKILREIGIPDHLTSLLRNLHVGQEAALRTGHGTTNGSKFAGIFSAALSQHCLLGFEIGQLEFHHLH